MQSILIDGIRAINKAELIAMIMEKSELTKAQVETVFKSTFDVIAELLAKQDKVIIPQFGGFSVKKRSERRFGRYVILFAKRE